MKEEEDINNKQSLDDFFSDDNNGEDFEIEIGDLEEDSVSLDSNSDIKNDSLDGEDLSLDGDSLDGEDLSLDGDDDLDGDSLDGEDLSLDSDDDLGGEGLEEDDLSLGSDDDLESNKKKSLKENVAEEKEMDLKKYKKLFSYLDNLLDSLPEEEIKKFALSEYYQQYIEIIKKLKI